MFELILGILLILFAWMQAAYGKLQKYKIAAREQWIRIDALLKTRSDYTLRLLEFFDGANPEVRELQADIYDLEGGYSHSEDREVVSSSAEGVTPLLDQLFLYAEKYEVLTNNLEFQGLKNDLFELEEEIIFQSLKYNQSIDLYNTHRKKPGLKLQITILGAIPLKSFNVRTNNVSQI